MRKPVLVLLMIFSLLFSGCSGVPPLLGVQGGKLPPCPRTPNCVSSQGDARHSVPPLSLRSAPSDALDRLNTIVLGMPRTRIVEQRGGYLRAEFTSALFRFVDDVEFLVDEGNGIIHVRSSSRVGRSDFGVNRKRIEEIRKRWDALTP